MRPRFLSPPPPPAAAAAGARQRIAEAVSDQELHAQVSAYLTGRLNSNPEPKEIREARAEVFASFPWTVDLYISLAFAAYRAARELGLCIPEELSVVGDDHHQLAVLVTKPHRQRLVGRYVEDSQHQCSREPGAPAQTQHTATPATPCYCIEAYLSSSGKRFPVLGGGATHSR
ncbi:hypothetical protein [Actinoplanes sp. NPDC049599]|uniref:hypothetical protein n=1 Tax=Actinoplanes sp. NPDC049599 TaxID=3363903 RepID=UPI0037AAD482